MEGQSTAFTHTAVVHKLESMTETEKQKPIKEGIANVIEVIKPLEKVADYVHVGVIGSTSFYDRSGRSERICEAIGRKLAQQNTILFTGGMTGIAESMGKAFWDESQKDEARKDKGRGRVFHLLPAIGFEEWNYGVTITAGAYMEDRRIILAKCAQVFVMVEGGPGTVHEAQCAERSGAYVIPIYSTGRSSLLSSPLLLTICCRWGI